MIRPLFSICGVVSVLSLVACSQQGDGASSAAPASSITVAATCEDAAARYGEHFADSLASDPQNPLPADLREKAKGPIKQAVVTSCVEDEWPALPLDCLSSVFEKPLADKDMMDNALSVCAGGAVKVFLPTRDKTLIKRDEPVTFQGLTGRDIEMMFSRARCSGSGF